MAAIILSVSESDEQIISGIPEYLEFTTDVPSTVFYTLDGTTPDSSSEIAVDKLYLPTTGLAINVKAIAISGILESDLTSLEYGTSHVDLNRTRLVGEEGINVWPIYNFYNLVI